MNAVFHGILFYIMWIALHYSAPHLYAEFCTPLTIQGFLLSPLMAPSPHCVALRWALNTGGDTINVMWFAIGTTALSYLIRRDR
jgi:hypothetical protein